MAPKRTAPPSPVEAVKKALRASLQAVTELGDMTLTGAEVNEMWQEIEKVAQAAPERATDDSATAPLDPIGMAAELRDTHALSRYLMGLLGKSLPLLSSASDAGAGAVEKEVRAVHEHYTLRDVWEGLPGLKQACEDASAAMLEREAAFSTASGQEAKDAARQAYKTEKEKHAAAEAKYNVAVDALEAAKLDVSACLDNGAFPRELPASYDVGGQGPLPPDARENEREVAYNGELAKSAKSVAAADAAAAAAATPFDDDEEGAAAAAAAAAEEERKKQEEEERKQQQQQQQLKESFKDALGLLPPGRLTSYAIQNAQQEEDLTKTLKAAGAAAKALMAAPHGCVEAELSELAGDATVAQLKAYPAAGGTAFTWAALAEL